VGRPLSPVGLGLPADTEHPGGPSYRALIQAVAACLPARRRAAAVPLAAGFWTSLHGIVDLRITKPELPWHDTDVLVNAALCAVHAAASHRPNLR